MCKKSRVGKNTVKTDAKWRAQHFFVQVAVACRLSHFCLKTPQKPMRKQHAKSIPGEQSAKTRVSAHASKEIAPPRAAADASAANNNNNHNHNNQNHGTLASQRLNMYGCVHVCVPVHVCTHAYMCACAYGCTYVYRYGDAWRYVCASVCRNACMHANV